MKTSIVLFLSLWSFFSLASPDIQTQETIVIKEPTESAACAKAKENLKEGDLIFIQIDNIIYRKLVQEITDSWTSHVGLAFKSKEGQWLVSESTYLWSKDTELCKFLRKSKGNRFALRRLQDLRTNEIPKLRNAALARMGQYYDTGFDFDEKGTSFCSKYTYEIYKEALGVELGKIETLGEIRDRKLAKDPDYDYSFVYLWFVRLKIPWERRTVTPESQYSDSKLATVLESY